MKSIVRLLALALVMALVGCATTQSGSSSQASSSGTVKMLTDEDYKKLGIQEVDRQ